MANTIQDKLAYLEETKEAIKQSIIAKGVSVSESDTFRSYADKIEAIQAGGSIAGAPSGIRFSKSTFTTVPVELFPYLEQQTDMSSMFYSCKNLTTVPAFDTSRCTVMTRMFESCSSLTNISLLDTSSVTNMDSTFQYCTSLTLLPPFDTSSVTNMVSTFLNCSSLTTIPLLNTANVNRMGSMFSDCTNLTTVPLLNVSSVTSMSGIFNSCSSLANLGGFTGLKVNLDLGSSYDITVESVMNVINAAADMTSEPKTLILKQYVFNKLSEDQIATATAKGWNIASRS